MKVIKAFIKKQPYYRIFDSFYSPLLLIYCLMLYSFSFCSLFLFSLVEPRYCTGMNSLLEIKDGRAPLFPNPPLNWIHSSLYRSWACLSELLELRYWFNIEISTLGMNLSSFFIIVLHESLKINPCNIESRAELRMNLSSFSTLLNENH